MDNQFENFSFHRTRKKKEERIIYIMPNKRLLSSKHLDKGHPSHIGNICEIFIKFLINFNFIMNIDLHHFKLFSYIYASFFYTKNFVNILPGIE